MPGTKLQFARRVVVGMTWLLFTPMLVGCGRGGANPSASDPSEGEDTHGLTLTVSENFPAEMRTHGTVYAVELKNTGADLIKIRDPIGGKLHTRIWQDGTNLLVSTSDPDDIGPLAPPLPPIEATEIKMLHPGQSFKIMSGFAYAPGKYRVECTYQSREEPGVTWTGQCKSNTFTFTQTATPAVAVPEPPSSPAYSPDSGAPFDPKAAIEGLASRNSAPIAASRGAVAFGFFRRGFDWSDQDRVYRTFAQLEANANMAWPELSKHFDDHRYAITYRTEAITTDGTLQILPISRTVGDLCLSLARRCFEAGFDDLFPSRIKGPWEGYDRLLPPGAIGPDYGPLRAWCIERQDKPLYEIQLEMCARARVGVPLLATLSDTEKWAAITQIEQRVREIAETKTARLAKRHEDIPQPEYYDEAQAEAIRVKYPKEYASFELLQQNGGQPPLIAPPAVAISPPIVALPSTTNSPAIASPSTYTVAPVNPSPPTVAQPPVIDRPSVYQRAPQYPPAPVVEYPRLTDPAAPAKPPTDAPKAP